MEGVLEDQFPPGLSGGLHVSGPKGKLVSYLFGYSKAGPQIDLLMP